MAVHAAERLVAPALQGKVELRAELFLGGQAPDHGQAQLLRLQRPEPHALHAGHGTGRFHRVAQAKAELLTIGGKVDSGQHRFAVSLSA